MCGQEEAGARRFVEREAERWRKAATAGEEAAASERRELRRAVLADSAAWATIHEVLPTMIIAGIWVAFFSRCQRYRC